MNYDPSDYVPRNGVELCEATLGFWYDEEEDEDDDC